LNSLERQFEDVPEESAAILAEESKAVVAEETADEHSSAENETEQNVETAQNEAEAAAIEPMNQPQNEEEVAAPVFIPLNYDLPVMNDGDGIDTAAVNFDEDLYGANQSVEPEYSDNTQESGADVNPADEPQSREYEQYDRIKTDKTIHEILSTILSVNEDVPEIEETEESAEDLFPDDQIEKL
jgi:hypothetical protein